MIREHHDSCLYYIPCKTCESSFADVPSTVVFDPNKNISTGIFPKTINIRDIQLPNWDDFVHSLHKLQRS